MKRLIFILMTLCLFTNVIFANENQGDEYDDGYVYEQNGAGDQFLKIDLAGCFPLNFNKKLANGTVQHQLYTGFAFDLGYYRFLNSWFALGGEVSFTSNWSIGEKLMYMVPVVFGALLQPSIGNFEFPIYLDAGLSYESWASISYFPSPVAKASAGVFYRINDSWSVGGSGSFLFVPQFYKDSSHNIYGCFATAQAGFRFHF